MSKIFVFLYQEHVSDLQAVITRANNNLYDSIICPIVFPNYAREFNCDPMKTKHLKFSRSDLILTSNDWFSKIIAKISDIDCDSKDDNIRRNSEKTLLQEISFSEHLIQHGYTLITLHSSNTINLARTVSTNLKGTLLIEVPMVDPKAIAQTQWRSDLDEQTAVFEDTWTWWNNFRSYADFNFRIKIALEMSSDLPSDEEIDRWLGEPVECLIIPSSIFIRNSSNYPVLSKAHQTVIAAFVKHNIHFAIKSNLEDGSLRHYSEYIKFLIDRFTINDPMLGFDDLLEVPLQPLYDNLDSYTYEIFEKDPTKYILYQKAIEAALFDRVSDEDVKKKITIVMVLGGGRGPLVRAALNASKNTGRQIKVYIIEKNPNAIITLRALIEEMWSDRDIELFSCDMREFVPPEKADILVSELLGSFGDNELSPECLDGAQKHLKDNGISIPSKSTSYLNPLMSSKVFNNVRIVDRSTNHRDRVHSYLLQAESPYVVYIKNGYHISEPEKVFEFNHPNREKYIDNTRFKQVEFNVKLDCVLNGFVGYFEAVLYKDITISIHPITHTKGMTSWFSIFFPISEPQQLKGGDTIKLNMWRCIDAHKVWYEWNTTSPQISHIHNHNARSSHISL